MLSNNFHTTNSDTKTFILVTFDAVATFNTWLDIGLHFEANLCNCKETVCSQHEIIAQHLRNVCTKLSCSSQWCCRGLEQIHRSEVVSSSTSTLCSALLRPRILSRTQSPIFRSKSESTQEGKFGQFHLSFLH